MYCHIKCIKVKLFAMVDAEVPAIVSDPSHWPSSFSCPTTDDLSCVFPFKWNGEEYTECIDKDNDGVMQCPVIVQSDHTAEIDAFRKCACSCSGERK